MRIRAEVGLGDVDREPGLGQVRSRRRAACRPAAARRARPAARSGRRRAGSRARRPSAAARAARRAPRAPPTPGPRGLDLLDAAARLGPGQGLLHRREPRRGHVAPRARVVAGLGGARALVEEGLHRARGRARRPRDRPRRSRPGPRARRCLPCARPPAAAAARPRRPRAPPATWARASCDVGGVDPQQLLPCCHERAFLLREDARRPGTLAESRTSVASTWPAAMIDEASSPLLQAAAKRAAAASAATVFRVMSAPFPLWGDEASFDRCVDVLRAAPPVSAWQACSRRPRVTRARKSPPANNSKRRRGRRDGRATGSSQGSARPPLLLRGSPPTKARIRAKARAVSASMLRPPARTSRSISFGNAGRAWKRSTRPR